MSPASVALPFLGIFPIPLSIYQNKISFLHSSTPSILFILEMRFLVGDTFHRSMVSMKVGFIDYFQYRWFQRFRYLSKLGLVHPIPTPNILAFCSMDNCTGPFSFVVMIVYRCRFNSFNGLKCVTSDQT